MTVKGDFCDDGADFGNVNHLGHSERENGSLPKKSLFKQTHKQNKKSQNPFAKVSGFNSCRCSDAGEEIRSNTGEFDTSKAQKGI